MTTSPCVRNLSAGSVSSCELLSLNIGICKVKSRQQVRRIRSEQSDDSDEFRPGNVVESSDDSTSEVCLGHNILLRRNTVVPSSGMFESWSCCTTDVANGERRAGIRVCSLALAATTNTVLGGVQPGGLKGAAATDLYATSLTG